MSEKHPTFSTPLAVGLVVLWLVAAALLAVFVPEPLVPPDDGTEMYLGTEFESMAAQVRLRELFPEGYRPSTAVVVLYRPEGLALEDIHPTTGAVRRIVDWVRNPTLPEDVPDEFAGEVRGYLAEAPVVSVADSPALAARLNSSDGTATLVLVGMPDIFSAQRTQRVARAIRSHVEAMDLGGLQVHVTGDAGFYTDYDSAARESLDRSAVVSLVLIIVILLAVYRSPATMLVPLITIVVAAHTAMRLLYLLSPVGFEAGTVVEMFVVVIVFGSATDYCLFIISRYREETLALGSGDDPPRRRHARAMGRAWRGTAAAIAASAATTMAGLSLMALADFRAFEKAGPSIAVALGVGCIASLSLAPAVAVLMGRAVFWPHRVQQSADSASAGLWRRLAALVVRRPGAVTVAVLLLLAAPSLHALGIRTNHDIFDELSDHWDSVRGFQVIRDGYAPGAMGPGTLLVEADAELDYDAGWELQRNIARALHERELVDDVLWAGRPLGDAGPALDSLDDVADEDQLEQIESWHFSGDLRAARMELVFHEAPYTDRSIDNAATAREVARAIGAESGIPGARAQLAGPSSTIADIKIVARRDFRVVSVAVLAAVYLILLVVLRRPVLGLFLVGGTVLSFSAALGATDWVFTGLLGEPGLDWKIKFFLLVLLVAVGVDYNIYVCTRIREERRTRPIDEAVRVALERTGGIVSACGLIVAGTFASMIAGSLSLTVQLGFALALGILVDTFLVRPLAVPAVALMLARLAERRRAAPPAPDEPATEDRDD